MKIFKRTMYVIGLFVFIGLTIIYLNYVLRPKNSDDSFYNLYYRANSINFEEKNSLDVIFYGDSNLAACYSPMQTYESIGLTSFIRSGSYESMKSVLKNLKEDLKKQSPKLIAIETDIFYQENTVKVNSQQYKKGKSSIFKYHSRWKELGLNDFIIKNNDKSDYLKGGIYYHNSQKNDFGDYMNRRDNLKLVDSVKDDFKKICEICKKNKIEIFLFTAPLPQMWTNTKHNDIQELASEKSIEYYDFNMGEYDFDMNNIFRDNGVHCSKIGTIAVTNKLTEILKQKIKPSQKANNVKELWDAQLINFNKDFYSKCDLYNNTVDYLD